MAVAGGSNLKHHLRDNAWRAKQFEKGSSGMNRFLLIPIMVVQQKVYLGLPYKGAPGSELISVFCHFEVSTPIQTVPKSSLDCVFLYEELAHSLLDRLTAWTSLLSNHGIWIFMLLTMDVLCINCCKSLVYIRPAGSYVTDQLELRRAVLYPGQELAEQDDMLVLIGTFGTQTGLHSAEAAFVERQVEELPEHNVLVLPMVKDLFLVGLLVAERIMTNSKMVRSPGKEVEQSCLASGMERGLREPSQHDGQNTLSPSFTIDQKAEAVKIARSLALAYVMDQVVLCSI
eukprot:Gb_40604 [translate_table: standard]